MRRSFPERIAAAEKALNAHLDARECHIERHQAWRQRLLEAQEYVADAEEARTQTGLIAVMDDRIRGLQMDAQRANRDLKRLTTDKTEAIRDPSGHATLLRIIGKWEHVTPESQDRSRDLVETSNTRLGLVNIQRTRTGPSLGFFLTWA